MPLRTPHLQRHWSETQHGGSGGIRIHAIEILVKMMNLINVNAESFIAKIAANDDLGNLGVVSLHIDPYIRPKVLPSRNIL